MMTMTDSNVHCTGPHPLYSAFELVRVKSILAIIQLEPSSN